MKTEMTFEEYRTAVIEEYKKSYPEDYARWGKKELLEEIKDWDKRGTFRDAYNCGDSISSAAYCLMMCV